MVLTVSNPTLHCPIRGALKVSVKAKDGLTFTEEKFRIDCLRFLLSLGYTKEYIETETIILRFGHKGVNSLRADIVVYSIKKKDLAKLTDEKKREKIIIIAEIKRDGKSEKSAKNDQLKPAISIVPNKAVLGIYWDDVEQSLFYKSEEKGISLIKEAAIAHLPPFGSAFRVKALRHSDLEPSTDLVKSFERFDDILHQAGHDLEERYDLLLQIILIKIYDEQNKKPKNDIMIIQDFSSMTMSDTAIMASLNSALQMSLVLYQKHLLKKIDKELPNTPAAIKSICKTLCKINLLGSTPQVMQDFYMYFARHIYKVDLAQYFTPYEVVDFIVRLVNPKFGDSVKDPACGSADFLVAAYRIAKENHGAEIADQVYGTDTGQRAVQISVLNMILNGDGKSNIKKEDSLLNVDLHKDAHTVLLCNPPFGKDILERRPDVLSKFELARSLNSGEILDEQETGLLFVEVCVNSAAANQRIAIILPNGYLGNRSDRYFKMRKWLLSRVRIVAIVGFPRFTFKKSGADVSASVLIMEKLEKSVSDLSKIDDYPMHFNLLNNVGWDVRNKRAERVYQTNQEDGSLILDDKNNPIIDADFERVMSDIYNGPVVNAFPWLTEGLDISSTGDGWTIQASEIFSDQSLIIDPKRYCQKYINLRDSIKSNKYFSLGKVLEVVTTRTRKDKTHIYRYVEIANIFENFGAYDWEELRGWKLPGRAKHLAKPKDIFIAHIWSSAGKWFIAGDDAANNDLIVTSGCYHLRIKPGKENYLADLVFGLSTEAFRTQMRALATGSDGLSVVSEDDLMKIVLPKLTDSDIRKEINARASQSIVGKASISRIVQNHIKSDMTHADIEERSSHVSQV